MPDSEEAIQEADNETGSLATKEDLKQFDTQGEAIEIEQNPRRCMGQEKIYQTPYVEIKVC